MRRGRARRRAAAFALALVVAPAAIFAQPRHRVVLLEQPNTQEAGAEVLARVRGELTAAGFEVVLLPATPEGDPAEISETAGGELEPAAAIFVVERPAEGSDPRRIELWLSDRLSRRTFVQSLPIDSDDAGRGYRRLAVQAVELLKARLAELLVTRLPEPPPDPEPELPPPPPPLPRPTPQERPGVTGRLSGGVALLQGFEGVPASFAPRGRVGASIPAGSIGGAPFVVDFGGTLVALSSISAVRENGGEAMVGQGIGTIDLALRFDRGSALQPLLAAGAGFYAVNVDGVPSAGSVAREVQTWSVFTSVGAGFWIQPADSLAIELEGQVGRAWAKTVVRINQDDVAETGSPLLLLSLALVGVF